MTTRREDPAKRMSTAAKERTEPGARPGQTAISTKRIRVTLDLDPAHYAKFNRWLGYAAIAMNPDRPRLSLAKALRAMIDATADDQTVSDKVIDRLRAEDTPLR
jgi:hypothetical protein